MTDLKAEARAIALAAAGQVHDNADARCVETLVEQLVDTALTTQAAEIERLRKALEPVAFVRTADLSYLAKHKGIQTHLYSEGGKNFTPLYTLPQPPEGDGNV